MLCLVIGTDVARYFFICIISLYILQEMSHSHTQTVVVENPMSVDESGKLVSSCSWSFLFFFFFLPNCSLLWTFMFYDDLGKQCCRWSDNREETNQLKWWEWPINHCWPPICHLINGNGPLEIEFVFYY